MLRFAGFHDRTQRIGRWTSEPEPESPPAALLTKFQLYREDTGTCKKFA